MPNGLCISSLCILCMSIHSNWIMLCPIHYGKATEFILAFLSMHSVQLHCVTDSHLAIILSIGL